MQTKLYLPPWWSRIARLQPFCYFSKVGENIVIFQMGREDLVRQCKLEASNLSGGMMDVTRNSIWSKNACLYKTVVFETISTLERFG